MREASAFSLSSQANITLLTILSLPKRKTLPIRSIRILLALYSEDMAQNDLRGEHDGKGFYAALNEVRRLGYVVLLRKSVVSRDSNKFYRTPNIWGLTDKGREWVNKYIQDIEDRVERARHGY